jgi:hypothetical protein
MQLWKENTDRVLWDNLLEGGHFKVEEMESNSWILGN